MVWHGTLRGGWEFLFVAFGMSIYCEMMTMPKRCRGSVLH